MILRGWEAMQGKSCACANALMWSNGSLSNPAERRCRREVIILSSSLPSCGYAPP